MTCERVVIINDFSLARGGATALALLSARLFRDRGLPVTLFCGDDASKSGDLNGLGINIVPVGGKPLLEQGKLQAMASGLYNTKAKAALEALIAEQDTPQTIYHVHAWSLILSPSIFTALQPVAPRVIVHSHDQFLACPNGVFYDFQKGVSCNRTPLGLSCMTTHCDKRSYIHKGWRVARQALLGRSFGDQYPWGAIAIIHPRMEQRLKTFGYANSTMVTVRNPVSPFTNQRVKVENNSEFFFVGRMEPDKGVVELARAAQAAGVQLVTIGEGPLSAMFAEQFPEVRQEGWCDKPRLQTLLQTARAVVMPSLFAEPFGMVAIEAQQSGIPVIIPDTAFLAEEIAALGLGISCNIHDTDAFALALTKLKDMPATQIKQISETAFANATPLALDEQAWGDALLDLYTSVLAKAA